MLHATTDSHSTTPIIANKVSDPVSSSPASSPFDQYKVIRRNGSVVVFEPAKISIALTKAFLAVNGGQGAASARVREMVEQLTNGVVSRMAGRCTLRTFRIRLNWV
jgi:ribonucleoside-diphosphate reductase alpha chain